MRTTRQVSILSCALPLLLLAACEDVGTELDGGVMPRTAEPGAPDLRLAEQALLASADWETVAVFTARVDTEGRTAVTTRAYGTDLPHRIDLTPMHDWIRVLGGEPTGVHLKVHSVHAGAADCALPALPLYEADPRVGCVVLSVVNKTGLDIPTFVLEAFPLKGEDLPSYDAPAGHEVPPSYLNAPIAQAPEDAPGPLWWFDREAPSTIALPLGGGPVAMGWRILAQREVCGNGVDDDGDGRPDENCRDVADGGACVTDLDCASGVCTADTCEADEGRWVTLGVYDLDWEAAKGGTTVLRSVPVEGWPASYLPADVKTVLTTHLIVDQVGLTPAECDLPMATPYDERGVACGAIRTALSTDAFRRTVLLEWIGGAGGPYEQPYQLEAPFDELPNATAGDAPDRAATWLSGQPTRPGGKSHVMSAPLLPVFEGGAGGSARFRVVAYDGPSSGPKEVTAPANPIAPGTDVVFPSACLDDRSRPEGATLSDAPEVYNVVAEFGQILAEIGWTPEYLTNEFVAQSYGEGSAFEYLVELFGVERLSEAFTASVVADMFSDPMEAAERMRQPEEAASWTMLLAPDPSGRFESYWGLRALAEHGALSDRAIEMSPEGQWNTTGPAGDVSFTYYEARVQLRRGADGQPIPGSVRSVPTPRHYVLPRGEYVVRQSQTLLRPYHGPMPGYCAANGARQPTRRGGAPEATRRAHSQPPNDRWGFPSLAFYGWEDVTLDACGSSIQFRQPTVQEPAGSWLAEHQLDDPEFAALPVCATRLRVVGRELKVSLSPLETYQSLMLAASDDVTIRGLRVRGDMDRLRLRHDALVRSPTELSLRWNPWDEGLGWNDMVESPGDPWSGGVRTPLGTANCLTREEFLDDLPAPSGIDVVSNDRVFVPSALRIADSHRVRLENVSSSGGWDGLVIGTNENLSCPGLRRDRDEPKLDAASASMSSGSVDWPDAAEEPVKSTQSFAANLLYSIDVHSMPEEERVGRYPESRWGIPGACDAINCTSTSISVVGGWFRGNGRNSVTYAHARRVALHGVHLYGAASAPQELLRTSPGAGLDAEPDYTRKSPRVRVLDSEGAEHTMVLSAGELNIVGAAIYGNRGTPVAAYSSSGRVDNVRIVDSVLVSSAETERSQFASGASVGLDYYSNLIIDQNGSFTHLWTDGGDGLFVDNTVVTGDDITFGWDVDSARPSYPTLSYVDTERNRRVTTGETAEALEADAREACEEAYDGPSPYPRCLDVMRDSPAFRPAQVQCDDRVFVLQTAQSNLLTTAFDTPWDVYSQRQPLRAVVGNSFTVLPTHQPDAPQTVNLWRGEQHVFNVDVFARNSFAVDTPGGDTTGLQDAVVSLGAPQSPAWASEEPSVDATWPGVTPAEMTFVRPSPGGSWSGNLNTEADWAAFACTENDDDYGPGILRLGEPFWSAENAAVRTAPVPSPVTHACINGLRRDRILGGCGDSERCGARESCVDDVCRPECDDSDDCPEPYQVCSGSGYCVGECISDRECDPGEACVAGDCIASSYCDGPGDDRCRIGGDACSVDEDGGDSCSVGDQCIAGRCEPACVTDAECGPDAVCHEGMCVRACDSRFDCAGDLTCIGGACVEAGEFCESAADCPIGMSCYGGGRCIALENLCPAENFVPDGDFTGDAEAVLWDERPGGENCWTDLEALAVRQSGSTSVAELYSERRTHLEGIASAHDGWWFPLAEMDRLGGSGVELDTLRPWLGDRDTVHPDFRVEFCGDAPRE
jgi:hypothetical protein